MAFVHGKKGIVLLSGTDVSVYSNSMELSRTLETANVSTFGDCANEYIPGIQDGGVSLGGFWDGAAAANDELYTTILGDNNRVLMVFPGGAALGSAGYGADLLPNENVISSNIGDAVAQNLNAQSNQIDRLLALHDNVSETGPANGASIDNGAATSNGAVIYLSVSTFTGTNIDVTVEDSPDDAIWSTLGAFTSVGAAHAAERIEISGTVDRYVRVIWAGTFSEATFVAGISRK